MNECLNAGFSKIERAIDAKNVDDAKTLIQNAYEIKEEKPIIEPLIYKTI